MKSINQFKIPSVKMHSESAGKNQRKFINHINDMFVMDEGRVKQIFYSLDLSRIELDAVNNNYSLAKKNGIIGIKESEYKRIIEKQAGESTWWKLAHTYNTDKARSLPYDLKSIVDGVESSVYDSYYFNK